MEAFQRIASIIFPVLLMVAVGYAYARLRGEVIRKEMAAVNRYSAELLCPLLLFSALASKDFDLAVNLPLMLAGGLISLGSGLLAWPVARLFGYDVRTFVPPMIYNNCGNMGIPLAILAFGPSGLSEAAAMFMAGSLVYFTVGIRILESGRHSTRSATLAMFKSPMMLSMMAGMTFAALKLRLPAELMQALRMLDVNFRSWRIGLAGALVCPLAGLAVALVLDQTLTLTAVQRGQMYLFASLPPAVFSFIVAESYRQEPDKVAGIVMLGNLAALGFVPLGLWMGLPSA